MLEIKMISGPIVHREEEKSLIATRLDALINRVPVSDPVIFFHGVSMVGKTALLKTIQKMAIERGAPHAYIDFDKEQYLDNKPIDKRYDGEKGQLQLAADILAQLKISADAPSSDKTIALGDSVTEQDLPRKAAQTLIDYIHWVYGLRKRPVVLLFDTLEDAPPDTYSWLQEEILAPLLKESKDKLLAAMAARSDYVQSSYYPQWPVSAYTVFHHLRPFNRRETKDQLRKLDENNPWLDRDNVLALTGGIPGLNQALIHRSTSDDEKAILQHMVDMIFARLAGVSRHLQEKAEERGIVSETDQETDIRYWRAELLAVSVFRQFDIRLLVKTVESLWPDRYHALGRRDARNLLTKLRQTTLVQQHPDGYGYTVPHDIRRVFDTYQRRLRPDEQLRLHTFAARWFRAEVEQGDVVTVADELYHLAGAWLTVSETRSLEMPTDLPNGLQRSQQLEERLRSGLTYLNGNGKTPVLIDKIKVVLKGEEFTWLFSRSEIKHLQDICDSFLGEYDANDDSH